MIINVTCRDITPLFMNRMSESTLEGLRTKAKKAKSAAVGNTRTPREDAEPKVYLHGKLPIIPAENLMACLIAAGVFVRLDAKRQISTGKSTILPGLMTAGESQSRRAAGEPSHVRGVRRLPVSASLQSIALGSLRGREPRGCYERSDEQLSR